MGSRQSTEADKELEGVRDYVGESEQTNNGKPDG